MNNIGNAAVKLLSKAFTYLLMLHSKFLTWRRVWEVLWGDFKEEERGMRGLEAGVNNGAANKGTSEFNGRPFYYS